MLVNIDTTLLILNQKDWLNESYTDKWNNVFLPIYKACIEKCTVLKMVEKDNSIVCVKFKFNEHIIEFYPHWVSPKWDNESISWDKLKEKLDDHTRSK
ncbi:MAG: hypothetical protein RLY43_1415 [Bacteroidota bacterium]